MRILRVLVLSTIFCLLAVAPGLAGPVLPDPVSLTQPDGATIDAIPFGDEWDNGYETADGYTIVQDQAGGAWSYAVADQSGKLVPSALQPGRDNPDTLSPHLRNSPATNPNRFDIFPERQAGLASNFGSQPVLALLVSFSNRQPLTTVAQWSALFFGASDSAKAFYNEISYNQFTLAPAAETYGVANDGVIGWLNLGYPHPNTGSNTGDANRQIVRDAILAANPYINFAQYDTNHDGHLSTNELHIVVIVAGYETSYGGAGSACSPNVWAHRWSLYGSVPAPTVDGVSVGGSPDGGYAQFGEWHCRTNDNPGHMGTMGQMVHELGHDINWPDLYDVDYTSAGIGYWSIMAGGSWNKTTGYAGTKPAQPDAFLKWYQGWVTPQQISGSQTGVQLAQSETNQRLVQILNNPNGIDWVFSSHSGAGEYFLLENRQRVGFDAGLPGCGILIWHIDETRTSTNDTNSDPNRRLVDLEQADGARDLNKSTQLGNNGDAGDPYPGSTGNRTFNGTSNPNSNLYSGAATNVSVTNISSSCAATMSADIAAPGASTPIATATLTPLSTATRTPTYVGPTCTATRTPTATRTGTTFAAASRIFLPVIVKDYPPMPPTPTPTVTATPGASGWSTIVSESFEGAFPGAWQVGHFSGAPDYLWSKSSCRALTGGYSGWAVGGGAQGSLLTCGSNYPNGVDNYMIFGPFSLVGATAAGMTFDVWAHTEQGYDGICYMASVDGDHFYGTCGSGNSYGWIDAALDLANVYTLGSLLGQPNVWLGLFFSSDGSINYSEGIYVDNIVVRKCPSGVCSVGSVADSDQASELLLLSSARSIER